MNLSDQVKALETVKEAYHHAFCEIWATIHVEANAKEPIEKLRAYINEWNLTLTNLGETGMPPIIPPNGNNGRIKNKKALG